MKKYSLYIVLSFLLVFLLLQVNNTHIIGGDFSLYLRQAISIFNTDASELKDAMQFMLANSSNKMFSPILYPWGFSILLSPIVLIFGLNYWVIKAYLALFFVGGLWFLAKNYQTKELSHITAILLVLLVGLQPEYFTFLGFILSEMPYFFFVMLSIWSVNRYIIPRYPNRQAYLSFIGIGVLLMFTAQIRTEGVLLFIALFAKQVQILYKLYTQKELSADKLKIYALHISPYFAGLLFFIVINILPSGFMHHTTHLEFINTNRLLQNMQGYFENLQRFIPFSNSIKVTFLLLFAGLGMIVTIRKAIVESVFVLVTIMLLIVWPHQNSRHLFTIVPFIIYFFIAGISYLIPEKRRELLSQLTLAFLLLILIPTAGFKGFSIYQNHKKHQTHYKEWSIKQNELSEFVKQNIPTDEVIAFAHSRWLLLHTDRKTIASWGDINHTKQCAQWYIYCTFNDKYFQHSSIELTNHPEIFQEKFRNDLFIIYKIEQDGKQ